MIENRIQMIFKMVIEFKFCTPKPDADLCMRVDLPLDKKNVENQDWATGPQILNKTPQNTALTTRNYFRELRRYDLHWWKDDERWSTFFFSKTKSRNSCHTFVIVQETKTQANQLLLLLVGRCMMKKETTAKKLKMAVRSFLPISFSLPLFFFFYLPANNCSHILCSLSKRKVSFSISVRWSIYIINSVDKPNFRSG